MKKIIVLIVLGAIMGCANRSTGFTFVSTKNFNHNKEFVKIGQVTGSDTKSIFMVIPTGSPRLEEAIDNAIESTPGCCALTDVKVYKLYWYIPFLYGKYGWSVKGTALKQKITVIQDSVDLF